jgi:hypothetical protein
MKKIVIKTISTKKMLKSSWEFFKKYFTLFIIALIFFVLVICDKSGGGAGGMIINNLKSIATSFTPTTDLFDDGSEVSFVSYFFGGAMSQKDGPVKFMLPTMQQSYSSSDDFLCYDFDGVVSSVANGTVSAVGWTLDNQKYIEIEHAKGYKSRYVGVYSLGVSTGDKVLGGSLIASTISGQKCKVSLFQNNNMLKISEVEWVK